MADPFATFPIRPTAVPQDWCPITPGTALPYQIRAIRATGAGNVSVVTATGQTRVMAFAAGETRLIAATAVNSSGTTATGLEGAY